MMTALVYFTVGVFIFLKSLYGRVLTDIAHTPLSIWVMNAIVWSCVILEYLKAKGHFYRSRWPSEIGGGRE